MTTELKRVLLIIPVLLLSSCFGLFDSGQDVIVGEYEIGWIDIHETRAIYKQEEVIPAYVFAVGHNSKYIIAKQHPLKSLENERVDYATTNYFIIDIEKHNNSFNNRGILGPLGEDSFNNLRREFRIEDLEFDMLYPEHL